MLPRFIYELLPYLYLVIGFLTGLIFDSDVIFIAASLLIVTGFSVLYMRYNYRHRLKKTSPAKNVESTARYNCVNRRQQDRRQSMTSQFPLIDCSGCLVTNDRRITERRALSL